MLYYVGGDDSYSIANFINEICAGKNQIEIDMTDCDLGALMSQILTIDLFEQNKAYILKDFKAFSNKSESYSKADYALINKILNSDELIIVRNDRHINRSTKLAKMCSEHIQIHHFDIQNLDFETSVKNFIKKEQIAIEEEALQLVCVNFPNNIFGATNDLAKLWSYTNNQLITVSDVQSAGQRLTEHKIYDLYNLVARNEHEKADRLLQILRQEGISDSELLVASFNYFRKLYETNILINSGQTDFQIGQALGVHSFIVKQNRKLLRACNDKRIEKLVQTCGQFDYYMKSGQLSADTLIEQLAIS